MRSKITFNQPWLRAASLVGAALVILIGIHLILQGRAAPTPILGPDTSHHNGILDASRLKAEGMVYHWMKVSQGRYFNDSVFATSRSNAVRAGLIPGGYHFLEAGNGAAQCLHYLDRLNATGGIKGIMLAVDVELQNSTTGPSYQDVLNFLAECKARTPGRTWVIYTGAWYWGNSTQRGYLGNPPAPSGTVLWISKYVSGTGSALSLLSKVTPQGDPNEPYAAAPINGWPEYAFRQYSESATIAGVTPIDANVTYKGLTFLRSLAGLAEAPKPDLVVTNIAWTPAAPEAGNAVTFSATIKNQGTAPTPDGIVQGVGFSVDGTKVSWSTASKLPLQPGESRTVAANGGPDGNATWTATAGSHNVVAHVDDELLIAETDETNNRRNEAFTVSAPDTTVPTTAITSPATGASFTVGTNVTLTASASDNVGVTKVEFYVDGVLKGSDTAAPYSLAWNTTGVATGPHTIRSKAYDAAGNAATSTAVSVGLTAVPPPGAPGDANGDNRVNALDYSIVRSNDGQDYPPADFNGDGTVNAADMAIVLDNWTW